MTPLDLLGTDQPAPERRTFRAGPLSLDLVAGQVRDLRWHGVLVLRGLLYVLRDAAWGTLPVTLSPIEATEGPTEATGTPLRISVRYLK